MKKRYDTITVKKYANRRLYDTSKSTYITLNDISEMVREGLDFIVVDAKTNEDLTHTVLAQIVLEQEGQNPVLFPTDFMRKIISMYDKGFLHPVVPNFLSQTVDAILSNQEQLQEQFSSSFNTFPGADQLNEINKRNIEMFENAMQMFNPFMPQSSENQANPANDKDEKIAQLQREIDALKKELGK